MSKIISINRDGYTVRIYTTDSVINFVFEIRWCCENFGLQISTPDHFLGSTIIKVCQEEWETEEIISLTLITDKGDLIIKAWNFHENSHPIDVWIDVELNSLETMMKNVSI